VLFQPFGAVRSHPFGLSLSKPSLYQGSGEGQGFDKLSPNGEDAAKP
jgi:hypothetical protein